MKIERVRGLEILDSRGNPTVAAEVTLAGGVKAIAHAPSGASTGRHEAVELRDGGSRHDGRGTLRAVSNIDRVLGPAVAGIDAGDQTAVDAKLIATDGTPDKSALGANAILSISCAAARAFSIARGLPLWRHLAGHRAPMLPAPMINILSGGLHAGRNIDFQDFLVIPLGYPNFPDALEAVIRVHRNTEKLLRARGCILTGVADEGGWGPRLESNEQAVAVLREAITTCDARMDIALDVAATHFAPMGSAAMTTSLFEDWIPRYGITSIEDPLPEDDWTGWKLLTARLGKQVRLVGDDLFATNLARLDRGIREGVANSVLIKMNQIGTVTETLAVVDRAREAGYGAVISARSGETEDSFLADLAVASGAGQIKIGSITRSERLAKYNRLLEIERWELT